MLELGRRQVDLPRPGPGLCFDCGLGRPPEPSQRLLTTAPLPLDLGGLQRPSDVIDVVITRRGNWR